MMDSSSEPTDSPQLPSAVIQSAETPLFMFEIMDLGKEPAVARPLDVNLYLAMVGRSIEGVDPLQAAHVDVENIKDDKYVEIGREFLYKEMKSDLGIGLFAENIPKTINTHSQKKEILAQGLLRERASGRAMNIPDDPDSPWCVPDENDPSKWEVDGRCSLPDAQGEEGFLKTNIRVCIPTLPNVYFLYELNPVEVCKALTLLYRYNNHPISFMACFSSCETMDLIHIAYATLQKQIEWLPDPYQPVTKWTVSSCNSPLQ